MLAKKPSIKKLLWKVKARGSDCGDHHHELLLGEDDHRREGPEKVKPSTTHPTGSVPVYVGEERRRFVVPTGFLSHPLFKMLLEKAHDEFGFQQRSGLMLPCSVAAFQEVLKAVERCSRRFEFGDLVEEFI